MNTGLYSGVSAMRANQRRLEAITANLSNVSTPAYKRLSTLSEGVAIARADPGDLRVRVSSKTDFTQGPLERTENPLDLALQGEGFFAVEGPEGQVYTRNGSFRLDERGTLTTADGRPVAWRQLGGGIDPVGQPVRVDTAGTVFQGSAEVGALELVAFDDLARLRLDNDGYYRAPAELERDPATAEVHQYALEGSNVSSIDELVAMITVQRSFESAAALMQKIDETYRRLNGVR